MRRVRAQAAPVIRMDEAWLAVDPLDMRAGFDTALRRVVTVFGAAHPHHAYLFANRRANRVKLLVHDGIGIWLAARRLDGAQFVWPHAGSEPKRCLPASLEEPLRQTNPVCRANRQQLIVEVIACVMQHARAVAVP